MHRYESWLLQVPVWALKYCMAHGLSLSHYLKVASSFQMRTTIGFIWRQSGWSIYTWLLQCAFKGWWSTDVETAASTEVIPQEVRSFLSKQNADPTFWALLRNFYRGWCLRPDEFLCPFCWGHVHVSAVTHEGQRRRVLWSYVYKQVWVTQWESLQRIWAKHSFLAKIHDIVL